MTDVPFSPLGLDHVVLRAADAAKLVTFYHDVLGFPLERTVEKLGLYQLRAGASLIDIVDAAGELGRKGGAAPGDDGHNVDHLCLRVEPWDEAALRAYLEGHGIDVPESGRRYGADGPIVIAKTINATANPLVILTNNLSAPCPPKAVLIACPPIAVPMPPVLLDCNRIIPINMIQTKTKIKIAIPYNIIISP